MPPPRHDIYCQPNVGTSGALERQRPIVTLSETWYNSGTGLSFESVIQACGKIVSNGVRKFLSKRVKGMIMARTIANRYSFNPCLAADVKAAYKTLVQRDHIPNPVSALGYSVQFLSEQYLRYLFGEIFLQLSYACSFSTASPVIFDCGSNIGISVLFFKRIAPGARVVAFEPTRQRSPCCGVMSSRISLPISLRTIVPWAIGTAQPIFMSAIPTDRC